MALALVLCAGCAAGAGFAAGGQVVTAAAVKEEMPAARIKHLLVEGKFAELDMYADKIRREKTRGPGGAWKLTDFYGALDSPRVNDQDTIDHLAHVEAWIKARPDSITPRIVMARSLTRWAWVARGNGMGDSVSPQNAQLFAERAGRALQVLKGSEDMKPKDPQWFSEMMMVGTALGWTPAEMRDVYERGAQLEPGYYHLNAKYANYLRPQWYGEAGDPAKFARKACDRVGGGEGDVLYFQLATYLIGPGYKTSFLKDWDWNRLQQGYRAIEASYGLTPKDLNELGFLAYKFHDQTAAQKQFALIKDDYSEGVWRNRKYFDKARDWAGGRAGDSEGAVTKTASGTFE